ncbi:MAG: ASCH domain-containing protein [Sphingobium sp.]|uniref:ASCH domain-containing protein n=1 Tax=Sphingobium sp. TaxID=1912891 RepID=UPI003BB019AC
MKALTIWQPWASLIIAGAKPFEFRRNRPPRSIVGQRIVIHAGKMAVDRDQVAFMRDAIEEEWHPEVAELCLHADKALPVLEAFLRGELPMAAGIGTAIVGEARLGTDIARQFGIQRANDSDRDDQANWGWPMLDIEPWPAPVPARGMQGLWPWPDAASFAEAL